MFLQLRPAESYVQRIEFNPKRFYIIAGVCGVLFIAFLAFGFLATMPLSLGIVFLLWPKFAHGDLTTQRVATKMFGQVRSAELDAIVSIVKKGARLTITPKSGKKVILGPLKDVDATLARIESLRQQPRQSSTPSALPQPNSSVLDKALSSPTPKDRI